MRRLALLSITIAALGGGIAGAKTEPGANADALRLARSQAAEAIARSQALEGAAARATDEAARARAENEALAARIQAAEADISAAETRLRIVEALRTAQQTRLAEAQAPLLRLTAALQMMARRPPALALVQPGSVEEVVQVRSLLAATLPVIRARTETVRAEVETANRYARQAMLAREALVTSRAALGERRAALARFETAQRSRSASLAETALFESDRALAFDEEARNLAGRIDDNAESARIGARLAALPAPLPRPGGGAIAPSGPRLRLPVEGPLLRGVGEISAAGVHARGLTFRAAPGTNVVAPADGRILYARPFRSYGQIVLIDHGGGWTSVLTDLAAIHVAAGAMVRRGQPLGRTAARPSDVSVELRHEGRPVPFAARLAPR